MNQEPSPDLVLLHNPACSKSRAAKQWLDDQAASYETREYLTSPLDAEELLALSGKLGAPLRDWVRDGEAVANCQGQPEAEQNRHLAEFLEKNPAAMQRPILIRGDRARIGRPLEALQELI